MDLKVEGVYEGVDVVGLLFEEFEVGEFLGVELGEGRVLGYGGGSVGVGNHIMFRLIIIREILGI